LYAHINNKRKKKGVVVYGMGMSRQTELNHVDTRVLSAMHCRREEKRASI
jgi:hypothetical protein